jgi:diguanylate cyclase (GGDEF)-like protein/PAS domain S-box-containing protein
MTYEKADPLAKEQFNGVYSVFLENLQEAVNILDEDLRIIFWNAAAEQITGYSSEEVLGKPCLKNVLLDMRDEGIRPCHTQCPVKRVFEEGGIYSNESYLQHKEGYRFPVEMRIIPIKNQDGKIIAALETFREFSPKVTIPQKKTDLERMGLLDPLTEQGNRRYVEMHLNSRLEEMKRYGLAFGVLFVYVDDMQHINDKHGSVVGDKVLKMIGQTLANNTRFFEVAGRWNGEQFVVVLLNIDSEKLDLVANKLRLLVEQSHLRDSDAFVKTTVSIGATLAQFTDTTASLTERARKLADHSKWLGKNCVSLKIKKS